VNRVLISLFLLFIIGCDGRVKENESSKKAPVTLKSESVSKFILETIDGKKLHK